MYLPVNLKEHQFQDELKEKIAPANGGALKDKVNERSVVTSKQRDELSKSYSNLSYIHSKYGTAQPRRSGRDGKVDTRARGSTAEQGSAGEHHRMLKTMISPQS